MICSYLFLSIDWKTFLLGEEDWSFLPEVLLRSSIMFIVAMVAVRLIGKRGIMQGVFELVTIITLGSAAGDPMFYKKVGILPAILVFVTIIIMYKLTNMIVARWKAFEHLVEGKHVRLVKENRFVVEDLEHTDLSKDELYSDLRLKGVSHLGQVDAAYIEASGEVSVFFHPDEKVDFGLPVLPELIEKEIEIIDKMSHYSCAYCGQTEVIAPAKKHTCGVCKKTNWIKSIRDVRVK